MVVPEFTKTTLWLTTDPRVLEPLKFTCAPAWFSRFVATVVPAPAALRLASFRSNTPAFRMPLTFNPSPEKASAVPAGTCRTPA